MKDYLTFLTEQADPIAEFRQQQAVAFAAERQAWGRSGEFDSPAGQLAASVHFDMAPCALATLGEARPNRR